MTVALGDLPTWLAVFGAFAGAGVALGQLRGQRRDIARQARQLERQQADQVDIHLRQSDHEPPGTPASGRGYHKCWLIWVSNGSRRPVRNVAARLQPAPGEPWQPPGEVGQLVRVIGAGEHFGKIDGLAVRVLRAEAKRAFSFPFPCRDYGDARMAVRFTDDAGLHWEIDHDLHLRRLKRRDW